MSETNHADLIAALEAREHALAFPGFSLEDAWRLGNIVVDIATTRALGIAIDITRGDQQVFKAALEGSNGGNDKWIARKIRTANLLNTSTLLLRLKAEMSGSTFDWLDPTQYVLAGGCVPLRVAGGAIVGTLTVSGLTDVADHELVLEAMEAFLATK